jgi:hypothetical protein
MRKKKVQAKTWTRITFSIEALTTDKQTKANKWQVKTMNAAAINGQSLNGLQVT